MFAHIRRHQKWLWIFISALVIISFVWLMNPNQQYGSGPDVGNQNIVGSMYGEPIKRAEYNDAYREALLQYLLTYGDWPEDNEFTRQMRPIERETRSRLLLIRKLNDYKIEVSEAAAADWIVNAFQDRQTKQFHPEFVTRFHQTIATRGLRPADFERYVKHQVGIQHLAAVAGAPGKLITPQEAEYAFRNENEKADTKVVLFPLADYLARVEINPETIGNFYTNSSARYRLPERVQLSYVAFPASNFLAQADERLGEMTNLNQQIDQVYLQRGPQFYSDLNGQPMAPEAAKQQIRDEVRKDTALMEARRTAFDFANELYQIPVPTDSPNPAETLENLAAAKSLTARETQPFSQFEGPRDINVPDQLTRLAFELTPESPIIPEPITGEDAVYIVSFKRRVPSELQPLEAVRDQVTEDFRRGEALRMAREAALQFASAATNALASGGTLEAAAEQQGLRAVDLPPFTQNSREPVAELPPFVDAVTLRSAAFELKPGEISSYLPTREGGFLVLLEQMIPASDEEVKTGLAEFTQELRRRTAAEAFNSWFVRELELARLTIAGDQDEVAIQ